MTEKTKTSQPSVSIIIPTWNGEQWLEQLLSMLEQQTLVADEILIIDSGSTDKTCAIASSHNVRVHEIAKQDFDHGGTRTLGASLTTGKILVYMTQDAIPANREALKLLVQPLMEVNKIAAAYGRQLPYDDATIFSAHLRSFNYPDQSQTRCWEDRGQFGFKTIFISNSFAAYRRDVLAAHGFFPEQLLFGEDTLTVAKLLENGYYVKYVSESCVYHSHNYSILHDFKRYFDIGVFHVEQGEQLMKFGGPGGAGKRFVRSEIAMLIAKKKYYLFPESFMRILAKFVAYNAGKRYKILPRWCARRLSMHRGWWLRQV